MPAGFPAREISPSDFEHREVPAPAYPSRRFVWDILSPAIYLFKVGMWPASLYALLLNPLPLADFARFSTLRNSCHKINPLVNAHEPRARCHFSQNRTAPCTNSGHRLVGGVHSIEIQADRVTWFLLTLKIEGVER